MASQRSLTVLQDSKSAELLLDPTRMKLLALLAEPASAAQVARKAGLPRQKVNYHLRLMEEAGLLEVVEERSRGSASERILQASARAYAVGPGALGEVAPDPVAFTDRYSLEYLQALAFRALGEVSAARSKGGPSGRVPCMSIEHAVHFRSPQDRSHFATELSNAIAALVKRYDEPGSDESEAFRFVLIAHPLD